MSLEIIEKDYTKFYDDMLSYFRAKYPLIELVWPGYYTSNKIRWIYTRAKPKNWFAKHGFEFLGPLGSEGQVHCEIELWMADNPKNNTANVDLRDEYNPELIKEVKDYLTAKGFEVILRKEH